MPCATGSGVGVVGALWRAALAAALFAAVVLDSAGACSPGRSAMSRYESQKSTPLVFKQFVPNRAENSLSASGQSEGAIARDSSRFKDLVENHNLDIVFKDEEGTGADRLMSQRCKDKLNSLAVMVMNQWPGVKLRVTESWDEEGEHADDSLHYEGRAVDVTTSDKDKSKLGMLARLAIDAGFDYVFYESRNHIHCSVKSDKSLAVGSGGCFSGGSSVQLANGQKTTMENLRVGDKVLAVDPDGNLLYDEVYAFLDRQPGSSEDYYLLQTEGNFTIAVTGMHLLFVEASKTAAAGSGCRQCEPRAGFSDSLATYARDVRLGDSLYVAEGLDAGLPSPLRPKKVIDIAVRRKRGLYAPATLGGTVVVDDVAASCYAVVNSQGVAHAALSPLRLAHRIRRAAAAAWLQWLAAAAPAAAASTTAASEARSSVANNRTEASFGVHWYAQLAFAAARSIAGDLLFK